jgi:hypothetical protein
MTAHLTIERTKKIMRMTPRRKEVLYHIAFTDEIKFEYSKKWKYWAKANGYLPGPRLLGVDVNLIIHEMRKHGLVRYNIDMQVLCVTPKGMDALLATVN